MTTRAGVPTGTEAEPGGAGGPVRHEHDFLGDKAIPATAYWGVHTARALENFPITNTPIGVLDDLVRALAFVKKAAARATSSSASSSARRPTRSRRPVTT